MPMSPGAVVELFVSTAPESQYQDGSIAKGLSIFAPQPNGLVPQTARAFFPDGGTARAALPKIAQDARASNPAADVVVEGDVVLANFVLPPANAAEVVSGLFGRQP